MKVYERLAKDLAKHDVRVMFGLMGDETAKFGVELERAGIKYMSSRHEAVAVGMADGFSRASHGVGVAVLSRGPGVTNGLTSIINAAKGGSSVLVIAGDKAIGAVDPKRRSTPLMDRKYLVQQDVLAGAGIAQFTLDDPARASADLAVAYETARRGLVVAHVPMDVLEAEAGELASQHRTPVPPEVAGPPAQTELERAVELILTAGAKRPVILAGRGASGARPELERLGDLTGSLLATPLLGKSMFAGNPFDIGVVGPLGSELCAELLAEADLILAFGTSMHPFAAFRGQSWPKARVIQFDRDPGAFGRYGAPVELGIVADATLAAGALAAELERRRYRAAGYRSADLAERIAGGANAPFTDQSRPGALDPRALMKGLDATLPKDRILVVDSAHHFNWSCTYLSVPDPTSLILPQDTATLAYAFGVALGVAVALPDRTVVLDIGDGGLMMTLGDLDTAVRYQLPVVVVVTNDGAFGAELQLLRVAGFPDSMTRFKTPSFEEIARAVGLEAMTVRTLDDLPKVSARLRAPHGPFLVDCLVTPEVQAPFIKRFASR